MYTVHTAMLQCNEEVSTQVCMYIHRAAYRIRSWGGQIEPPKILGGCIGGNAMCGEGVLYSR